MPAVSRTADQKSPMRSGAKYVPETGAASVRSTLPSPSATKPALDTQVPPADEATIRSVTACIGRSPEMEISTASSIITVSAPTLRVT
jgi:hypothetical protein